MDLSSITKRITYKPDWKLEFFPYGDYWTETGTLRVTATVPDARNTTRRIEVRAERAVPEHLTSTSEYLLLIKHVLAEVEIHELREFLRYDGLLVDDPHRSEFLLNAGVARMPPLH